MSAATPAALSVCFNGRWTSNWRTGGEADVVEGELANARVELEEERERLTDTAGGTKDGDLGGLRLLC